MRFATSLFLVGAGMLCFVIAGWLVMMDKSGWGWFIFSGLTSLVLSTGVVEYAEDD